MEDGCRCSSKPELGGQRCQSHVRDFAAPQVPVADGARRLAGVGRRTSERLQR
jgi:hypothetical protein